MEPIHRQSPETPRLNLDAIQARADAATEGPWGLVQNYIDLGVPDNSQEIKAADGAMVGWEVALHYAPTFAANAEFIAHAREDVPALVAEVRRLQEHNERLRTRYLATDKEATDWVSQLADAETEIRRLRAEVSVLLDKCDRVTSGERTLTAVRREAENWLTHPITADAGRAIVRILDERGHGG